MDKGRTCYFCGHWIGEGVRERGPHGQCRRYPPVVTAPYVSYGYAFWGPANSPIIVRDHRAELAIRLLRDEPGPGASAYSALLLREELTRRYGLDR